MSLGIRSGRSPYDYDVAVVGGGPAGLAAAIRARWVKGFDPFPSSVVLFECGPLGGLARLGACVLTGPSWALGGEDLVGRLTADVEALGIPHVTERVERICRVGAYLELVAAGRVHRCLAVVLAPGFRALGDEHRFFPESVILAMKGRAHLEALLARALEQGRTRGLVIVGNEHSALLLPLIRKHAGTTAITWLVDPSSAVPFADAASQWPGRVLAGKILAMRGDRTLDALVIETSAEAVNVPCSALFLDYHGFEIAPAISIAGLDLLGVARGPNGFIAVDASGATSAAGVFAAGDVTGRYAATLTALGDGVAAGFGAHRHAYRSKFGEEPDLFAYRGSARPIPASDTPRWLPPLDAVPVLIGDRERAIDDFVRHVPPAAAHALADQLGPGDRTLAELRAAIDAEVDAVRAAIRSGIHGRELALHRDPARMSGASESLAHDRAT